MGLLVFKSPRGQSHDLFSWELFENRLQGHPEEEDSSVFKDWELDHKIMKAGRPKICSVSWQAHLPGESMVQMKSKEFPLAQEGQFWSI